jgi:hypothetical protein
VHRVRFIICLMPFLCWTDLIIINGRRSSAGDTTRNEGVTWLLTEVNPNDHDRAFGLCADCSQAETPLIPLSKFPKLRPVSA